MKTIKNIIIASLIVGIVTLLIVLFYARQGNETNIGGFYSPDITGTLEKTTKLANTSVYATTTLLVNDSGTTYLLSGSGTTITLPIASTSGLVYRFIVNGDIDTASTTISSYYGDNIEGSLIVAGAVVDCDATDSVYFSGALENIGDYIELTSTGAYWAITGSGVLTAVSSSCSG